MQRTTIHLPLLCLLLAAASSSADDSASLRARLAALRAPQQAWQKIAWRSDLGEARREAAGLGRPLFIWAMNGNPLGCT